MQHVNLDKLDTATLRRYLTTHNLPNDTNCREDILERVQHHFTTTAVSEEDVVHRFLAAAKRHTTGVGVPIMTN